MRPLDRINLSLALLLAVLLAGEYYAAAPQAAAPLLALDAQQVSEIRVRRGEQLQLALLRDDDGWMLTHPQIERASTRRVNQLLALLQAHSLLQLPAQDAQRFGLRPALLELSFDRTQIRFGHASSPAGQRYVEVNGQIHLIDDAYFRIAGLPADFFREKP